MSRTLVLVLVLACILGYCFCLPGSASPSGLSSGSGSQSHDSSMIDNSGGYGGISEDPSCSSSGQHNAESETTVSLSDGPGTGQETDYGGERDDESGSQHAYTDRSSSFSGGSVATNGILDSSGTGIALEAGIKLQNQEFNREETKGATEGKQPPLRNSDSVHSEERGGSPDVADTNNVGKESDARDGQGEGVSGREFWIYITPPGHSRGRNQEAGRYGQAIEATGARGGIIILGAMGGSRLGSEGTSPVPPQTGGRDTGPVPWAHAAAAPPWAPPSCTSQNQIPVATTTGVEPKGIERSDKPRLKKEEELENIPEGGQNQDGSVPSALHPGTFLFFSFFGYRRIGKKNILENTGRSRIYQAILDMPGIDVGTLSEILGMNINTIRYHLVKLAATGTITCLSRPGIVRYYPNKGQYSLFEQVILHYAIMTTTNLILHLITMRPGISRQEIAEAIGITGPSVTRHMQLLIGDTVVRNVPDGMTNHYYLTEEAARIIEKLQVIPGITSISSSPVSG